jgi:hypothetical protein
MPADGRWDVIWRLNGYGTPRQCMRIRPSKPQMFVGLNSKIHFGNTFGQVQQYRNAQNDAFREHFHYC